MVLYSALVVLVEHLWEQAEHVVLPFLKFKGAVLGFGMVIIASSSGFYRVR